MTRIGRYLLSEVIALTRIGGRYEPCRPLFAVGRGGPGPYRWPRWAVLAGICRVVWLFWPVAVAAMSRVGRYLLCEEAALARIAGRHEPCWPLLCCMKRLFWPVSLAAMSRIGR